MTSGVNFDLRPGFRLRDFANFHRPWFVVALFATLIAIEALGFLALGTGRGGLAVAEFVLVLVSLLSIACTGIAFHRAQGITALFWFLFGCVLLVLLVPTTFQAYQALFDQIVLSDSTWRLLYCLYGAPILMMLFLPDSYRHGRVKSEIFLDLFQVAIVVGLIYATFFFFPARRMVPADALLRNIRVSDAQSLILMGAIMVRLRFTRIPDTHARLLGLGLFMLVCAVTTFIGGWIDLHHYSSASAWFNLAWALPNVTAGVVALTWTPSPEPPSPSLEGAHFISFLGTNLILVAMLSCINLLVTRWKQDYGETLTDVAITASLLAFALRLALTQFHQEQEITQRKVAQKQLATSHLKVGRLLDDARRQTDEITQISELGSLLQACASREEVFRLIPDRLRRLFSGASGCISLINGSGNRVESAAVWGPGCPADQIFSPEECWALRRGCAHSHSAGLSALRCSHLLGDGASVCIPLIANGKAIGTLAIQNDDPVSPIPVSDDGADTFVRRRQIAATVAEQVAVAVANVNLRESLRLQAVRDPLTGLYNRRYMQEFLDRELHSARRKRRPLAVMMLDLDHFKRYNDNFGHSAGDKALSIVGETLLRSLRADDVACRYGGEEFALILPECSVRQAMVRAEEIRKRLREQSTNTLTVSIGVAAFDETTDRVDLLLQFADEALYQAKHAGRNQVVAALAAAALPESDLMGPVVTA